MEASNALNAIAVARPEIHNDDNACNDCKTQSNNKIEEELKLPQEVDFCSIY